MMVVETRRRERLPPVGERLTAGLTDGTGTGTGTGTAGEPFPTIDEVDEVDEVDEEELREHVGWLSVARHFRAQPRSNRRIGDRLADLLQSYGYRVELQGPYRNVIAYPQDPGPCTLICAHYDSVPTTPGADDNASGVAGLLASARALGHLGRIVSDPARRPNVGFVAFNGEEDGMLGSRDFVDDYLPSGRLVVERAHVLEMIGFCSHERGSQRRPVRAPIPVPMPDVGDFLGLLGSGGSNRMVNELVRTAEERIPELRVVGLKTYCGVDRLLPVLHRSDHSPFWKAGIPSVLWTDTAEFRNPSYHGSGDLPATLDYGFLRRVTELLLASATATVP
jgi:Zn-dependent M28 family amino/carboxypeptidase